MLTEQYNIKIDPYQRLIILDAMFSLEAPSVC